jgi:hypothetical protein
MFGQGQNPPIELTEIGICDMCYGIGTLHCCEGERSDTVIEVLEKVLKEAEVEDPNESDVNPNG